MIPRILHQVWIGSTKIPQREVYLCEKAKDMHKDWDYIFWDESSLQKLENPYQEEIQRLLSKPSIKKASFIVDYIKIAIIHKFGGVYVDCDVDFINPLDNLDLSKKMIVSTQKNINWMQYAFLAAESNHEILSNIIKHPRDWYFFHWHKLFHNMYLEKIKQDHPEDFIDRDPNILDVNNYCNDLQVLDGSYFFGGKIAKHCGLLSHKKEKGIFEK